jgi:hypothetical protein
MEKVLPLGAGVAMLASQVYRLTQGWILGDFGFETGLLQSCHLAFEVGVDLGKRHHWESSDLR